MEIEIAFAAAEAIENTCPICQEIEVIHAISPCDHHICYKCSTRLRLLHQQFYCPICRAECPMVSNICIGLLFSVSVVFFN